MKPEMRLIDLIMHAKRGHQVVVIGEGIPSAQIQVGFGTILFRNYDKSGLLAIRVDTVWFMEYPVPEEVERLCRNLTWTSKTPRMIKGNQ